jgi:hypothetical protein
MDGLSLGHIPSSLFATVKLLRNVVDYRSCCPKANVREPNRIRS